MSGAAAFQAFTVISVYILKLVNEEVSEPYMDEPFHVPQAQAYCRYEWTTWDPKLTTPPGLYLLSIILKRIFLVKCNLSQLRLTPLLALVGLPIALSHVTAYYNRERPPSLLSPRLDAVVLSCFPITWFFGFLYYTEVPGLASVALTFAAAAQRSHWKAALFGVLSCFFRQTNIVWVLYAYAATQIMQMRYRRVPPGAPTPQKLHDPMALEAEPNDIKKIFMSLPGVLPDLLPPLIPYASVLVAFAAFVVWNGGIVLGDKSNHVPAFHIPQLYYFIGFTTIMGWPVLISGRHGVLGLMKEVQWRMLGTPRRTAATVLICLLMGVTVHFFTIHHPFLLSDNRHYTFYVWRRIFMLHPVVPYLLVPGYLACTWAWFIRVGDEQTLLQTLVLPVCLIPTLLPTPLLEPRYFLVPYVLLRAQIPEVPLHKLALEGAWYVLINAVTMWVFLYQEREGVGRFMW